MTTCEMTHDKFTHVIIEFITGRNPNKLTMTISWKFYFRGEVNITGDKGD